ncbi:MULTISPECIES: toxin-antitoxin system YwqK family antitoxin [unclassified Duganella]|uniref:toxin-antitoxin system YwqK family antitoxin n=1 Tax=unclassified Duganella TaxID=2636909 RepID=UPI000E347F0A|nr:MULTISPECIES: hypothetical protein [unclassified Duganella]RFP18346.1 hypothetical protein D0T23_00575 [Duganella sp. BJB475]RFP35011.1 hypothetical protein D0T21_00575 [Duganella sp. BJB476]
MLGTSRIIPAVVLCLIGLTLQGCSPKVDCNGDKVKEDVLTILKENLDKAVWYKEGELAFSEKRAIGDVKTISKNEELKTASCSAQYSFTYNNTERKVPVDYNLSFLEDKKEVQVLADANSVKAGVMQLVMAQAPVKNGTQKIYDPGTGKLVQSIEWKDNQRNGNQKMWLPDGATLVADINWINGKSNGWEKHPDSSGKIVTDLTWKEGLATGYQTIFLINGSPMSYTTFKDGKKNGVHKVFSTMSSSSDSYVSIEDNYKADVLDGLQKTYYDAKLEKEIVYKDGVVVSETDKTNSNSAVNASSVDKCVNVKIDAFHKANGNDAPINNDALQEWTADCSK